MPNFVPVLKSAQLSSFSALNPLTINNNGLKASDVVSGKSFCQLKLGGGQGRLLAPHCNLSQTKRNNLFFWGGVEVSGRSKSWGGRNHANRECTPRLPYYGDRDFEIAAPKLWNKHRNTIRECDTLPSFKSKLKHYLFVESYKDI